MLLIIKAGFDKFDVPVTDFTPNEIVDEAAGFSEFKFFEEA